MSRQEFDEALRSGEKLVILDNLVLDVKEFINHHPGGRFVIRQNVGQDVSKYFFGGYNLEDNLDGVTLGHRHTNYAALIVNDLVIAVYEKDLPQSEETV